MPGGGVQDNYGFSVLLVEDHRPIAELVCDHLEGRGIAVDYAADGPAGLRLAKENAYDVIVLDLMLPGLDGLQVCAQLRNEARIDTPVLMMTARDTLEDKIAGLDAGADDYLVKPFDVRELEARARALVRRYRGEVRPEILQVEDLTLDTATHTVRRAGTVLNPSPIGFKILVQLMRAAPRVVPRRELERRVWGELVPDSDALRSHLYNLRKAVDKPFSTPLIQTVQNFGYRLGIADGD
jgi:DNA-binding response OmpR family regulator